LQLFFCLNFNTLVAKLTVLESIVNTPLTRSLPNVYQWTVHPTHNKQAVIKRINKVTF